MAKNNAYLPNISAIIQAGINPSTELPFRLGNGTKDLLSSTTRLLEIQDRQDALNRFEWFNLPNGLNGELLERILYYRGQGAFFYMKGNGKFYFLPYALDGTIDVYGRYQGITPLPFNGGTTPEKGKKEKAWIQGLNFEPIYEVRNEEENENPENYCVLLHDYCKAMSENTQPRSELQRGLIGTMAECIPFLRTSLINQTGISGMKVNDENEQSNVIAASDSLYTCAISGKKWVPVVGGVEFQEFDNTASQGMAQEFLMAYQSLNNIRLGCYGLDSGGAFQKLGTTLQSESDMNNSNTSLIMKDSLKNRQEFCTLVNSLFGLSIWCEQAEETQDQEQPEEGRQERSDSESGEVTQDE